MRTFYNDRGGSSFGFNMTLTSAVRALIIANVVVFLVGNALPAFGRWFGLVPEMVVRGAIWQPFTYLFLHAGIGHILFNMLSLWMFGTVLEGTWGSQRFLRYYFLCGIGAGLCVTVASYVFGG